MGGDNGKKREVPSALRTILNIDAAITDKFCSIVDAVAPRISRANLKYLEISCHGVPWIGFWLAFTILWSSPSLYQIQVNFMIGLILDIVAVAVIKAITRRRRPMKNESDMFLTIGPDHYSFPSGHSSRAGFVASFFASHLALPAWFTFNLYLWSAAVCVSRVLLRRHHVLDVLAGIVLGLFETLFLNVIWFDQDWCEWLLSSFLS